MTQKAGGEGVLACIRPDGACISGLPQRPDPEWVFPDLAFPLCAFDGYLYAN